MVSERQIVAVVDDEPIRVAEICRAVLLRQVGRIVAVRGNVVEVRRGIVCQMCGDRGSKQRQI
jgi:hypothetical protein